MELREVIEDVKMIFGEAPIICPFCKGETPPVHYRLITGEFIFVWHCECEEVKKIETADLNDHKTTAALFEKACKLHAVARWRRADPISRGRVMDDPWIIKKNAAVIVDGMINNEEKIHPMTDLELSRELVNKIWAVLAIDSYESALVVGAITRLIKER